MFWLAVVFDEDATQTACTSVLKALQVLIFDSSSRLELKRPESTHVAENDGETIGKDFLMLGSAALSCVNSLMKNESTFIPKGETHRLENQGKKLLEIIEIQTGSYLGEDDITRMEDDYKRN